MNTLFSIMLAVLFALGSSALAETRFAYLSDLGKEANVWQVQADYVDLVTPKVAVARGAIAAVDARQYKAVLSNQNTMLRDLRVISTARVTLLTFPGLTTKSANLTRLQQMLDGDEALPSEFETGKLFKLTIERGAITAFEQVNTRALTGVYEQAVLITKKTTFSPPKFVLNFVNVYTSDREMRRAGTSMESNPAGIYISNSNPTLRTFKLAKNGRVRLLKTAGEYVNATLKQLQDGLNGQALGWPLNWDTYFQTVISDVTGEILELRQGYLP
jgi:hypothetical protein